MLDIAYIRENAKKIKDVCEKKHAKCDVDRLLEVDKKWREATGAIEDLKRQVNLISREIAEKKKKGDDQQIGSLMEQSKGLGEKEKELMKMLEERAADRSRLLMGIPNIITEDVPVGKDDSENQVMRTWGTPAKFSFKPKDHVELGENLDIIDIQRAGKVTGSRFVYLKGDAALLEFALVSHVFSVLTSPVLIRKIANTVEKGYSAKPFVPVVPPVMIKPEPYRKMARLSDEDKDERYHFDQDDLYLVGSAEHTLGAMYMDETMDEKDMPLRFIGFSTSFRREAGSYGKDVKGILRMHQFDKLEMESFTAPEYSLKEQNFLVAVQEYLVRSLKIPYRVVMVCTGDMGKPDARQIDIECWLPGQNRYRETHSADLMTDYQARRLHTRLRRKDGNVEFAHMNDATAFAIGRTLIAIMENNQQKDGSIKIPTVLQKYIGKKIIKKEKGPGRSA